MVVLKRKSKMVAIGLAAYLAVAVVAVPPVAAQTLNEALALTYRYNPRLDAQRAALRATDEGVAQAMAGFRPVITGSADVTYEDQTARTRVAPGITTRDSTSGTSQGYQVDLVQPIFQGFQNLNAVNEQEANVRAGRELLRGVEQEVLLEAVGAFMDVIRDQAIVRLRENNVNVLSRELKATEDRFAVGEVTRTDVAQAQARRAGSVSDLDLARANLKTSRAVYERVVGSPPGSLVEPTAYERLLPKSLPDAVSVGTRENPLVVQSLFVEQAARFTVDRIRGELLPQMQVEANWSERFGDGRVEEREAATVAGRLTVPIYEGGEIYSRVRQAKHIHVSRLQEIELARSEAEARVVAAWSQLVAARGRLEADRSQVQANTTALTGVREEERVGQRTLLDVLNAEVELLNAQVSLAATRRDLVVSAYSVLAAVGRLDAVSLGFTDVAYDPEVNYGEVRRKPWGTSITHPDGRVEELVVDHGGSVK